MADVPGIYQSPQSYLKKSVFNQFRDKQVIREETRGESVHRVVEGMDSFVSFGLM